MKKIIFVALVIFAALSFAGCKAQETCTHLIYGRKSLQPKYVRIIDSLVNDAISRRAMPGCRIIAVKNQYVIFNKSYGYLNYDSIQPVNDSTMYDVASVTKMAASALRLPRRRAMPLKTKNMGFPGNRRRATLSTKSTASAKSPLLMRRTALAE